MTKAASANLLAHLAGEVLTLATCWKVTRTDAQVFGFTDFHADLTIGGVVYKAATGHTASSVASSSGLAVDNLEVGSFLDSASITESDLLAGVWNHATVEIFRVNYKALADGTLSVRKGRLGEIRVRSGGFVAELRGMLQALQQTLGEVYSAGCQANLFDARCKLVEASFTVTGTVASVTDNATFVLDAGRTEADTWFQNGRIRFTSGLNSGLSMEVKSWTLGTRTLVLKLPMTRAVVAADAYSLIPGCLKRFTEDCGTKFSNTVNFRGFPHVPGLDNIFKRPS